MNNRRYVLAHLNKSKVERIPVEDLPLSTTGIAKRKVIQAAGGNVTARITAAKTVEGGNALILSIALSDGRSASARFHLYGDPTPSFWDRKYVYKSCSIGQAKAVRRR